MPDFFTNSAGNHHNDDRKTDSKLSSVNQHEDFRSETGLRLGQSINTGISALKLDRTLANRLIQELPL